MIKKIGTSLLTVMLLAFAVTPAAFADTNIVGVGNGAFSDSNTDISKSETTTVDQYRDTQLQNALLSLQNTGGNTANFNTGGSVTIITGDTNAFVGATNSTGSNAANLPDISSQSSSTNAAFAGNGAFSNSNLTANNFSKEQYKQNSANYFQNQLFTTQSTGVNAANFNTGTDVVIVTGDATSRTQLMNQTGSNLLQ